MLNDVYCTSTDFLSFHSEDFILLSWNMQIGYNFIWANRGPISKNSISFFRFAQRINGINWYQFEKCLFNQIELLEISVIGYGMLLDERIWLNRFDCKFKKKKTWSCGTSYDGLFINSFLQNSLRNWELKTTTECSVYGVHSRTVIHCFSEHFSMKLIVRTTWPFIFGLRIVRATVHDFCF